MKTLRHMILALLGAFSLSACTSTRDVTTEQSCRLRKGDIFVLRQACYFIDNPGVDQLIPVEGRELLPRERGLARLVPERVRVKFLGAYAESGFMVDTHIRAYGLILDGTQHGRKVGINDVLSDGSDHVPFYAVSTNHPNAR